MRISRQISPTQTVIDQKQLENVAWFNYLGSLITNDAICTWKIKSTTAMDKAAFNKKTGLTQQTRMTTFKFKRDLKIKVATSKMLHLKDSSEGW
jgi:hypothetical protein